jgi:hypothetical protein
LDRVPEARHARRQAELDAPRRARQCRRVPVPGALLGGTRAGTGRG